MADKAMNVYLNDHLSGAMLGSALAKQIQVQNEGSALGTRSRFLPPAGSASCCPSSAARNNAAGRTPFIGQYAEAARQLAPYEALARMVIRHRMANELSQEALAKMMGTSNTAISRLESGQHRPGVETLEKLARVFKRQLIVGFADPIEDLEAEPIRASVADHKADLVALA